VSQRSQREPLQVPQTGHDSDVIFVVLSQDNRIALSVDALFGSALLWDLPTSRVVRRFETDLNPDAVALSPSGDTAAICSDDRVGVWNLSTGRRLWQLASRHNNEESGGCLDLAFAQGGVSIVMAGSWSGRLFRASDGRLLQSFELPKDEPGSGRVFQHVAISPNGQLAFTAGVDGSGLWSIGEGRRIRTMEGTYPTGESVAFSHDGRRVVAGSGSKASMWDAETGRLIRTFERKNNGTISRIRFSDRDDALLAANSVEGTAWVWDVQTGAELRQFEGHGISGGIGEMPSFSDDGRFVIMRPSLSTDESPFQLRYLFDRRIRELNADVFRLWDARTGREVQSLRSAREPIRALALSPNGRFAAMAVGSSVSVFDLEAGGLLPDALSHEDSVNFVRFDHDGVLLLTESGDDDDLNVWNLKSLTRTPLIRPALPHDGIGIFDVPRSQSFSANGAVFPRSTMDAAFSLDGRVLVTREGNFLRVWRRVFSGNASASESTA
jgi:WD40 repeat protein